MSDIEPRIRPRAASDVEGDPFDWFLRIPNRLELMKPIRDLVGATCEFHGVGEDARQEILLVISELVNNAVEHVRGKGADGYHEVDVRFGIRDGLIVGRIVDEGEGEIEQEDFDGATQPSLDDDRGRGLVLIREYVDAIRVRRIPGVGTEVRFEKRFTGDAGGGES